VYASGLREEDDATTQGAHDAVVNQARRNTYDIATTRTHGHEPARGKCVRGSARPRPTLAMITDPSTVGKQMIIITSAQQPVDGRGC
jgi:hypothetical protein